MCNTEEETQAAEHACSLMVHEIAVCFARYTYRTGVKACANRSTVDIEQPAKFLLSKLHTDVARALRRKVDCSSFLLL